MPPSDDELLIDIILAARHVESFMAGRTRQSFDDDRQLQFAVQKGLEIIGEAASKLSVAAKAAIPSVPWDDVINMRHRLVHDYNQIDLDVVWDVVERDIPALISVVQPLVDEIRRKFDA